MQLALEIFIRFY